MAPHIMRINSTKSTSNHYSKLYNKNNMSSNNARL